MELQNNQDPDEQDEMIRNHIIGLRCHQQLMNTRIVFVPENMTGFAHRQFEKAVSTLREVRTLHQNGNVKPGICKDPFVTSQYVKKTQSLFSNNLIYMCTTLNMPVARKHKLGEEEGRKRILNAFSDQLKRFGYDEKGHLTGKNKKQMLEDDGAVAFEMICYWSYVALTAPVYRDLLAGS